jgi:UDPglucose 6-dehydrogenase
MNTIGVIGLGYVGTAVKEGFKSINNVVTYDINKDCTESSIQDVVIKAQIIFICVPTPMNGDGTCNIDIVRNVFRDIANVDVAHKPICILKSTVEPGTTDKLADEFPNITVCFNPEFLTERNYINDFVSQINITLGHSERDTGFDIKPVSTLYYERFPQSQVWISRAKEAEMIKYVANTMLSTKVAFLNEIYQICEKVNINYDHITKILSLDPRLGTSHWQVPGHDGRFGFGGTCFPKDLNALIRYSEQNGHSAPLLKAVWEKNIEVRPERDWERDKGRAVV